MGKENLLSNVELPFLKILFNNDLFSSLEIQKLDKFLQDIGLSNDDLDTYKQLQKSDISQIDREKVKLYYEHILKLFNENKQFIMSVISENESFKDLMLTINSKIPANKNIVLKIVFEYVQFGLLSLVTNYETKRVSKGIFDIVKK